ncbi:MAG: glycosyltransferase, partial [Bdellovibrionales bacterium]|nr:glycosyltransferase [Bdellovibrionales bacterium]
MKTGCVSIIITCYNYGHFLQECVESVINQTYSNWEAIIVDDGSTDDTQSVAQELVKRSPEKISYLRLENGGVSRARNIGLEKTSGEYILPLDADDMLFPWALEELVRCIQMDAAYGFAYGALEVIEGLPGEATHWFPGPFSRDLFQVENLASVTNLWKRELYQQGVHFREGFFFEDWDIWLQIIERGGVGGYTPKPIFQCRTHLDGRTSFARYYYFQGLAQQAEANPRVFHQKEYNEFTKTMLFNAPQSFQKTTAVFLVPYTREDGETSEVNEDELNATLFPLLEAYVASGHLACIFGNYVKDEDVPEGVYVLDFADMWDFEKVDPFFGTFGANLTLFNYGWDKKLLKHILRKPTVNLLVEMKESDGMPADFYYSHKPNIHCLEKERSGMTSKEYLFSDPHSIVSFLSEMAETEYQARKESLAVDRRRKLELSRQITFSNTFRSSKDENDITIIIPSRNIDAGRLRRCLSSIRLNTFHRDVPIIVSDFGSHPSRLEGLGKVCHEYKAHLEVSHTRAPWSRSRVLNIGAHKAKTHWLLFTDADMIFSS